MLWIDVGAPRREVYFLGLIDVLTQYDTKKKAAHAAKAVKHGVREQKPQSVCQIFIIGRGFRMSNSRFLCAAGRIWNLNSPPRSVRKAFPGVHQ